MEYISSKKIGHTDGLLRLIPIEYQTFGRNCGSVNKGGKRFSGLLINTMWELLVTLEDIRKATEMDSFIQQIKK